MAASDAGTRIVERLTAMADIRLVVSMIHRPPGVRVQNWELVRLVVSMIHRPPGVRVQNWELVRQVFNRVKGTWERLA